MTREEFIDELDGWYDYEIVGDKIVIVGIGDVDLRLLKTLPQYVEFMNKGSVDLRSLKSIPPGVKFNNGGDGDVFLGLIQEVWFNDWPGNIDGIDSKTLLNGMIKRGIFSK